MSLYLTAILLYLAGSGGGGIHPHAFRAVGGGLPGRGTLASRLGARLYAPLHLDRVRQPVRRRGARLPLRLLGLVAVGRRVGRHRRRLLPRAAGAEAGEVHGAGSPGNALRAGGARSGNDHDRAGLHDDCRISVPRRGAAAQPGRRHPPDDRRIRHGRLLRRVHRLRRHVVGRLPRRRQRRDDDRRRGARGGLPARRCRRLGRGSRLAQARTAHGLRTDVASRRRSDCFCRRCACCSAKRTCIRSSSPPATRPPRGAR